MTSTALPLPQARRAALTLTVASAIGSSAGSIVLAGLSLTGIQALACTCPPPQAVVP